MMIKAIAAFCLLTMTYPAWAKSVGGKNMPDTIKAGESELALNGAGLRKKFFIKVYAGGLYLSEKSNDANAIINADKAMAIRMHFIYDGVSAKKLIDAWNEGFANATGDNSSSIQKEINQFNSYFTSEAKEDDVYDIVYVPGEGVTLSINGKVQGTIKGMAFKKAVFGIWLCDKPADSGLKEGMLNQ